MSRFFDGDVPKSRVELELDRQAYQNWERAECDPEGANRRAAQLSVLLNDVIEEDLTKKERQVIRGYWFEKKSLTDIANEAGINPATASRTLRRAMNKIYSILRHVVKYQLNVRTAQGVAEAVSRAVEASGNEKGRN